MPEGLSAVEVGKQIAEHQEHTSLQASRSGPDERDRQDHWLSIIEAVLLSMVAVLAAYSGYAAAKWATESSLALATSSTQSTKANRFDNQAIVTRALDSVSFNAWFAAFAVGNATAERLAVKRFRPGYRPAFNAWLATNPAHNPTAPPGPAYMPQYVIPQEALAKTSDRLGDAAFAKGEHAGSTSDDYIRDTVFLATVLFLVGISSQFRVRQARYGLITIGSLLLMFSLIQLLGLPAPA